MHNWLGVFVNTRGFDHIFIDTSDVVYQILIVIGVLDDCLELDCRIRIRKSFISALECFPRFFSIGFVGFP